MNSKKLKKSIEKLESENKQLISSLQDELRYADLTTLFKVDFSEADLSDADLSNADLSNANLEDVNLSKSGDKKCLNT